MSETALVPGCLIYLKSIGCMAWRTNTGAMTVHTAGRRARFVRFNQPGTPDILWIARCSWSRREPVARLRSWSPR